MGTVKSVLTAALLATAPLLSTPPPVQPRSSADRVAQWRPIVAEASSRFGVPVDWIERVIRAESGGLTTLDGRPIRSKAGAIGLMQLLPTTWATMRATCNLGINPDDPHDNIVAGTAFLRLMYHRFGYPGLFAAYNAGPARYAAYLAGQARLPAETIRYLSGVVGGRSAAAVSVNTPPRQLLFALRRDLASQEQPAPDPTAGDGLFAIRKDVP